MTTTANSLFVQETETYNAHKTELLRTAEGKYVVIKGTQIFGIFDDEADAYGHAIRYFGLRVPFLLKRVQEQEEVIYLGGSALGLD